MNINDKLNQAAAGHGTTAGKLLIGPVEYAPQTVGNMRSSVIQKAQEALVIIKSGEETRKGGSMVRKIRHGFIVKIGYGQKNETLYGEDNSPLDIRTYWDYERLDAITYVEDVITFVEEGVFDSAFEAKLEDYRSRAEKGKEARRKKKKANNIASFSEAA